ncbi:antibiotic resistance protein MarC [Sulfolobus acidocaldarius SUSAZ]|nr:antibiotic resistance protein MarC [Sulfolobus acidocaldarius SUSAZ]
MSENLAITIATIVVKLFAIIDPFSVLPFLLAIYEEANRDSQERVSWNYMINKITIAILILLTLFSLIGRPLLDFLGLSAQALQIAGGVLLVYLGIDTMGGFQQLRFIRSLREAIVTPIATPLLVGPGTMTALISLSVDYNPLELVISSGIVTLLVYLSLLSGPYLVKILGQTGTVAAGRFTAIIIAAFGVQLILSGISQLNFK